MDVPLEIRFHGMDSSESVEERIREKVAKLERKYGRLVACRIGVEMPHRQHRTGNVYEVHIELSVPGNDLVVSKEPHALGERYKNPDIYQAINAAFDAAERQLQQFKEKQYGEVKVHDGDMQLTGTVSDVRAEQGYGFLDNAQGGQIWFHRNAVMDGALEDMKVGDRVHYVETVGVTGPQASKVWRAPNNPDL